MIQLHLEDDIAPPWMKVHSIAEPNHTCNLQKRPWTSWKDNYLMSRAPDASSTAIIFKE